MPGKYCLRSRAGKNSFSVCPKFRIAINRDICGGQPARELKQIRVTKSISRADRPRGTTKLGFQVIRARRQIPWNQILHVALRRVGISPAVTAMFVRIGDMGSCT